MITGRIIQRKSAHSTKRADETRGITRVVQQEVGKAHDRKVQILSARAHGRQPRIHVAIRPRIQKQLCPFAPGQLAHLLLDQFGYGITTLNNALVLSRRRDLHSPVRIPAKGQCRIEDYLI